MATGSPELRLGISFDIDAFKRTALPSLVLAATSFKLPIDIEFNRDSITNEMKALGRQLGQRKYRIDLNDTSIKNAINQANELARILTATQANLAKTKSLGGGITGSAQGGAARAAAMSAVVGADVKQGGPNLGQVKSIYSEAKLLGIVQGTVSRAKEVLVSELQKGFLSAGGDAIEGLIKGLLSGQGKLEGIATSLGNGLVEKLEQSLEIKSPSRRLFRTGQQAGKGFNNGLIAELEAAGRNAVGVMNTSLRNIDRMVDMRQRKARAIAPGQPNYELAQRQAGTLSAEREKLQTRSQSLQLGAAAGRFETGSYQQLSKLIQAIQIEANEITPNTIEWNLLQKRIAGLNIELQRAGKLANEIQMRADMAGLSPNSLAAMESRLIILKQRAKDIDPDLASWRELNKEIQKVERGIEKASRKPMTGRERLGAAGGAFLYGGGLGGGVGSAVGGIGGGLIGGVPGAFTGAAVGQAADDISKSIGAMTNEAATIAKLEKGLAIASNNLRDFASASAEVERISNRLLIPIEEVYRKFTQLKASTVALGIDSKTTGQIFEGLAASVLQSGGSLEDVDGAMRAVVQVFSKGKVNAEELRGQIGDRLPGAVVEFAQSAGMSMEQLEKAFEAGGVTLDSFVKFLKGKSKDTKKFLDLMATDSEYAGARMEKAFEKVRLSIGAAFQPTGAAFQNFFTALIKSADSLVQKLVEIKLLQPGSDYYVGQALAGGDAGTKDLERQLLEAGMVETKLRNAMGVFGNFSPALADTTKKVKILEKALREIRAFEKLTKTRPKQNTTDLQDKNSEKILDAIEKKEQALADARQKREEEIADIRKQAVETAKKIEEDFAKQRLDREREIAKAKRELAQSEQAIAFSVEATRAGLLGGDPELVRIQEQISQAASQREEEKIALEQKLLDEQADRAKAIEDFKLATANTINEVNARYAKAIGQAQQDYARSVAKIIDKGTESASKRLVAAAQIAALYSQRAVLNQQIAQTSGLTIPTPENGKYLFPGQSKALTAGGVLGAGAFADSFFPLSELLTIDKKIQDLSAAMSKSMQAVGLSVKPVTVNISDLTNKINKSAEGLRNFDKSLQAISNNKASSQFIKDFADTVDQQAQEIIELRKSLGDQLEEGRGILGLRQKGLGAEEAQQTYEIASKYEKLLKNANEIYKSTMEKSATPEERDKITSLYDSYLDDIFEARTATFQFSREINNIPADIQLNIAIQDAKDNLKDLIDPAKQLITASESIANAFSESFKGIIAGSMTAQQALAGFFQSIGDSFADMAAKMISEWLKVQVIQGIGKIFGMLNPAGALGGASTMGGSSYFNPLTGLGTAGPNFQMANGGILPGKFTAIPAFATGGIVTGPTLGLVGEGRYNEAVVPLPDGKSIPVDLSGMGGGAGAISTNIVINVSNGQAQSNSSGGASDLGRKMEGAVKQVIVSELRPGGLLAGGRR
jgi:tape measure domain-containing protein